MWEPDSRTDGELLVATTDDPQAFAIFIAVTFEGYLASSAGAS